MSAPTPRYDRNMFDALIRRVEELEAFKRSMMTRTPHAPVVDFTEQGRPIPVDGSLHVDYMGLPDDLVNSAHAAHYGYGGRWHPLDAPLYQIKIQKDSRLVIQEPETFIFVVPEDANAKNLISVFAYITTVGGGATSITYRNLSAGGADMLSTPITIDTGEYHSYTAATPPVVATTNIQVFTGTRIAIDVDAAGSGSKGLGVGLRFGTAYHG